MAEELQEPRGDWSKLEALEARLDQGQRLTLDDETLDLLRTVGTDVALAPGYVSERLQSVDGAEHLLREATARIGDGSRALGDAIVQAWRSAREGKPEDARSVLENLARTQPVPWYRELARREWIRLQGWLARQGTPG